MSTKSSNRASLAIAVLAILLILGGVFLLNQSFDSSSSADVVTRQDETSNSLQDRYTVNSVEDEEGEDIAGTFPSSTAQVDDSTSTVVDTPDAREPVEEANSTPSEPAQEPVSQPTTTVEEEPEPETPAQPEEEPEPERVDATNLSTNQFTAEITNISGNQYTLRLTGCGLPNALYCRAGTILQLYSLNNFTTDTIETGNQYRFTGRFSEDNSGMFIGSLSGMDRI